MNRQLIAVLVALSLAGGMYYAWSDFSKKYTSTQVEENLALLKSFEQGVPSFDLPRMDGSVFKSESLRGKLILINFWASWCDPCVREFPSMLSLVEHFKGRLVLVAISNDENEQDMKAFVKAFSAQAQHVELLWDPERRVSSKFGTEKLPETFLITPELRLLKKIIGVEKWYTPASIQYVEELMQMHGVR